MKTPILTLLLIVCIVAIVSVYKKTGYTIIQKPSPRAFERISPQTLQHVEPTFLIFHHTSAPLASSLQTFTDQTSNVSIHYMIDQDGTVYQHVPENKLAKHCGVSFWHDIAELNAHSIGIELVNLGYKETSQQPEGIVVAGASEQWYPYTQAQIKRAIQVAHDILRRNPQITPVRVLGHSDIAPCRKNDTGPLFPWRSLANRGIGVWPKNPNSYVLPCLEAVYHDDELRLEWLIKHLHYWGYRTVAGYNDAQCVISSFQMHFRQDLIDGVADKETADILKALLCEHMLADAPCLCSR